MCARNRRAPRRVCFPEYIYFTHKQSYIHTNIHTYILHIHTVLHSYKYISLYLIFFSFFFIKKQFDILLLCILCVYTVRARSLLKSMHFLLVVSRSCVLQMTPEMCMCVRACVCVHVCVSVCLCGTGHSETRTEAGLSEHLN